MIDHRAITFDHEGIEGVTLIRDAYMGFGLVTKLGSGFVIGSLAAETLFEAIFLNLTEGPGPRFYVPNCRLVFDMGSAASQSKDPSPGSLIVAPKGISLMVKAPRVPVSPLRLTGEPLSHAFEGICFTNWQIESPEAFGEPRVLYRAPGQQSERSEQ